MCRRKWLEKYSGERITYNDSNYFQIKLKQTFFVEHLQIIGFRFTRSLIENCRDDEEKVMGEWRVATLDKLCPRCSSLLKYYVSESDCDLNFCVAFYQENC